MSSSAFRFKAASFPCRSAFSWYSRFSSYFCTCRLHLTYSEAAVSLVILFCCHHCVTHSGFTK